MLTKKSTSMYTSQNAKPISKVICPVYAPVVGMLSSSNLSSEWHYLIENCHCTKKSFPLRISLVNINKSAENCGFAHIY